MTQFNSVKYLLLFLPMIIYFILINYYAVNLPCHDDYLAILDFLNHFSTSSINGKLESLLSQHNEHRLLSARLIYAAYYLLFGHINFRVLILLGNLQLVGIYVILFSFIKRLIIDNWFWPAMILSICIFDISNFENSFWAMACMSNFGVIFVFLLSLYFYQRDGIVNIAFAFLFQIIVTFSNGNGIIASFCLALFTIFSGNKTKMSSGLVCLLLFVPLYFFHYNHSAGAKSVSTIPQIFSGIYHFIGAHFTFYRFRYNLYMYNITCFGMLAIFITSLPLKKKFALYTPYLPMFTLLAFIGGTIFVCTTYRYYATFQPSKYLIYPHLLTAIAVLFSLIKFNSHARIKQITLLIIFVMSSFYCINTFNCMPSVRKMQIDIITHKYYIGTGIWEPAADAQGKIISDSSCLLKIYCEEPIREKLNKR